MPRGDCRDGRLDDADTYRETRHHDVLDDDLVQIGIEDSFLQDEDGEDMVSINGISYNGVKGESPRSQRRHSYDGTHNTDGNLVRKMSFGVGASPRSTLSTSPRASPRSSSSPRASRTFSFLNPGAASNAGVGRSRAASIAGTSGKSASSNAFARVRIDSYDEFDWQTVLDDRRYGYGDSGVSDGQMSAGNRKSRSNPSSPSNAQLSSGSNLKHKNIRISTSNDAWDAGVSPRNDATKRTSPRYTPTHLSSNRLLTPKSVSKETGSSASSASVTDATNPIHIQVGPMTTLSPSQVRLLAASGATNALKTSKPQTASRSPTSLTAKPSTTAEKQHNGFFS
jgi:hypothetical protein